MWCRSSAGIKKSLNVEALGGGEETDMGRHSAEYKRDQEGGTLGESPAVGGGREAVGDWAAGIRH